MCADLAVRSPHRTRLQRRLQRKEEKPTRETSERKSGETRRNLTHPKLSLGLPSWKRKSTNLCAYLRDIRASGVKNIENLLWKRIYSSVKALHFKETLRVYSYSRAIRQPKISRGWFRLRFCLSGGEMLPRKNGKIYATRTLTNCLRFNKRLDMNFLVLKVQEVDILNPLCVSIVEIFESDERVSFFFFSFRAFGSLLRVLPACAVSPKKLQK